MSSVPNNTILLIVSYCCEAMTQALIYVHTRQHPFRGRKDGVMTVLMYSGTSKSRIENKIRYICVHIEAAPPNTMCCIRQGRSYIGCKCTPPKNTKWVDLIKISPYMHPLEHMFMHSQDKCTPLKFALASPLALDNTKADPNAMYQKQAS